MHRTPLEVNLVNIKKEINETGKKLEVAIHKGFTGVTEGLTEVADILKEMAAGKQSPGFDPTMNPGGRALGSKD